MCGCVLKGGKEVDRDEMGREGMGVGIGMEGCRELTPGDRGNQDGPVVS